MAKQPICHALDRLISHVASSLLFFLTMLADTFATVFNRNTVSMEAARRAQIPRA
jgi:hypothetical protein